MSSLDELRSTLERQADALQDTERYIRPVAVRARIRAVRRRTTAIAAAATVAVLATVAGVVSLRGPAEIQPAHQVVGVEVPGEVAIDGFPYAVSSTADLSAERPRTTLASNDHDYRAVSLVGRGLGTGSATLYADGEPIARAFGEEDVEAAVPTGATRLRVRFDETPASARAGIAVYDWTGGLADGVSAPGGSAVFRDTIADDHLLTGAFADPGSGEVSVRFTGAFSDVRFSEYCTTDERGLWLAIEVDGQRTIDGPCQDAGRDPGSSGSSFEGHRVRDHVVRAYLTRGADGPEVRSGSAVVGVAVYRRAAGGEQVLGLRVPQSVEYAGRTWVLDSVETTPLTIDSAHGLVVGLVGRGDGVYATWRGSHDRGSSTRMGSGRGTASTLATELLAGDTYRLDVRGGTGRLVVYRPE